jgi:hypothetical protein
MFAADFAGHHGHPQPGSSLLRKIEDNVCTPAGWLSLPKQRPMLVEAQSKGCGNVLG